MMLPSTPSPVLSPPPTLAAPPPLPPRVPSASASHLAALAEAAASADAPFGAPPRHFDASSAPALAPLPVVDDDGFASLSLAPATAPLLLAVGTVCLPPPPPRPPPPSAVASDDDDDAHDTPHARSRRTSSSAFAQPLGGEAASSAAGGGCFSSAWALDAVSFLLAPPAFPSGPALLLHASQPPVALRPPRPQRLPRSSLDAPPAAAQEQPQQRARPDSTNTPLPPHTLAPAAAAAAASEDNDGDGAAAAAPPPPPGAVVLPCGSAPPRDEAKLRAWLSSHPGEPVMAALERAHATLHDLVLLKGLNAADADAELRFLGVAPAVWRLRTRAFLRSLDEEA